MNDYLNNIVARTLSLAPVVQPRLGSLFEPVSVATGSAGSPSFESETANEDQSLRNSTSDVSVRTPISQDDELQAAMTPQPKRRRIDRAVSSADEGDTQEQPVDTMIRHSTLTPPAPLVKARIGPSPLVSEPHPEGLPRPRAQTHEPSDPQANSPVFAEGDANNFENSPRRELRIRNPRNIAAGHIDQSSALGSNPLDRAQPARARTTHKSPDAIALMQPNSLPVTPSRRAFAEPAIAGEVAPAISVTIGRVDVRAVFSPLPSPRVGRAKQPTAMSLDDYLKKRNEGHR